LVATEVFAEGLLPHGDDVLVVVGRHSEEGGPCVDDSLGDVSRTLKLRHFVVVHEAFDVEGPPLVVDLFEGHQRVKPTLDLRGVSLPEHNVGALAFLGETEACDGLVDDLLLPEVLHYGGALRVLLGIDLKFLVIFIPLEELGAHAQNAVHLEHQTLLFLDGDQRKLFDAGSQVLIAETDTIFPNLAVEVSASVLLIHNLFGNGMA